MEKFRVFIKRYFVLRRYGTLLAGVLLLLAICLIVAASYSSPYEKYLVTSETSRREMSVKGSETQLGSHAKLRRDHPRRNHQFLRKSTTMSNDSQQNGDSQERPTEASISIERLPPLLVNPGSPHDDVREGEGNTEETKGSRPREGNDHFGKVKFDSTEEEKTEEIKGNIPREENYLFEKVKFDSTEEEKTEEIKGNIPREGNDLFEKVKFDSTEEEKTEEIKGNILREENYLFEKVKFDSTEEEKSSWENYTLCDGQTLLPNGAFCLEENHVFINGNEIWDGKLCRSLEEIFGRCSVLEVSAGLGHYGRCFYRNNHNVIHVDNRTEAEYLESNYRHEMDAAELRNKTRVIKAWEGYDGSQNIELLSGGFVKEMNLMRNFDLKQMYDWVLSLGVGQHVPKESLDTFLDNLTKHACIGIVFSWSAYVPESGVVTSEFTGNDLVQRMRDRGLFHDRESQDFLRDSARLRHLKVSVMVFRLPREKQC